MTYLSSVSRLVRQFLHLCSVYLGISGLVIVFSIFTLPQAHWQAKRIYATVVASFNDEFPDPLNVTHIPVAEPVVIAPVQPTTTPVGFYEQVIHKNYFADIPVAHSNLLALRDSLVRKYKIAPDIASIIIAKAWQQANKYNLDPLLILAVIAIESRYNPFVQSSVGAQGLMQVMPGVHQDKFKDYTGGFKTALNPSSNIEVGSRILRDCIRRRGSVDGGLACYVGATGPNDGGYAKRVQMERQRLALASGLPLRSNLGYH